MRLAFSKFNASALGLLLAVSDDDALMAFKRGAGASDTQAPGFIAVKRAGRRRLPRQLQQLPIHNKLRLPPAKSARQRQRTAKIMSHLFPILTRAMQAAARQQYNGQ